MNEYIFVSSAINGTDTTAITIIAVDEHEALTKAYSYFGGYKLEVSDFNTLCKNTPMQRMYRLFKDFTGQSILYFAQKQNKYYVDDLEEIKGEI